MITITDLGKSCVLHMLSQMSHKLSGKNNAISRLLTFMETELAYRPDGTRSEYKQFLDGLHNAHVTYCQRIATASAQGLPIGRLAEAVQCINACKVLLDTSTDRDFRCALFLQYIGATSLLFTTPEYRVREACDNILRTTPLEEDIAKMAQTRIEARQTDDALREHHISDFYFVTGNGVGGDV